MDFIILILALFAGIFFGGISGHLMFRHKPKNKFKYPTTYVKHPIDMDGKPNKKVYYCFSCGANVKDQKFCHNCGKKLIWNEEK